MKETKQVVSIVSQKTISYEYAKLEIITFLQHEHALNHFEATSSEETPLGPGLSFYSFLDHYWLI